MFVPFVIRSLEVSLGSYPHSVANKYFFLLAGHKVHFIAPREQTNPIFDPAVEKKSCATREKH